MTINKHEVISNFYKENGELVKTSTAITWVVYPSDDHALKNVKTGQLYYGHICVNTQEETKDFIEIEL